MKRSLFAIVFAIFSAASMAQMTPAGLWKTVDDSSGKERSLVRIKESGGVFNGTVEKFLDPELKNTDVCDQCTDDRKGKPVLGMTILKNLKPHADDKALWDGGDILDPKNGKVYRARLKPVDGGKKLEMRGYIGPFYRTQVWLRVE